VCVCERERERERKRERDLETSTMRLPRPELGCGATQDAKTPLKLGFVRSGSSRKITRSGMSVSVANCVLVYIQGTRS
jgi:hypothetical protein